MSIKSITDLKVWRATMDVTETIYAVTRRYPPEELYGLVSQMRRAVVSIGCNIAEGFGRRAPRDKARIYNIAYGSAEELKHLLRVSERLKFLPEIDGLLQQVESVSKMLRSLTDCVLSDVAPG